MDNLKVKAVSPINIALVKYWGKEDEELIIPVNSSMSITIDSNDMCSVTEIELINSDADDVLILNGKPSEVTQRIKML